MFANMSLTTHGAIEKIEVRYNEFKKLCDGLEVDVQNAIKHANEPQILEVCRTQLGRQMIKAAAAENAMTAAIEVAHTMIQTRWLTASSITAVEEKRKTARQNFLKLDTDAKDLKVRWAVIEKLMAEFKNKKLN